MEMPRFSAGVAEKTEYTVCSKLLPAAFDGFKIAHISDPHSRPAKGVYEIISSQKPDLTVITGDLVHDDDRSVEEIRELLKKLTEVSPVYMVTGNHDLWRSGSKRLFEEFEELGAKLLDGISCEIERNGERLAFFGVQDPFSKVPAVISENIRRSFSKLSEYDGYKILLFHRANLFDEIKDYGFDLILSGHMHGGQMSLPVLGGVLAPSSAVLSGKRMLFPKYCRGTVKSGSTTMIINRGIGNTLPIPRWGNRPEVGIITLRNKGL